VQIRGLLHLIALDFYVDAELDQPREKLAFQRRSAMVQP
jgi:hypothetical protein